MITNERTDCDRMRASKIAKATLLFFLMSLTVLSTVHVTSAGASSTSCARQNLSSQIETIGNTSPTEQQDINFATGSPQYRTAAAAFTSTIALGATDSWSWDSNCKVSWSRAAVTFEVQAANGSKYDLVVSENSKLDQIYSVIVTPFSEAGPISSGCPTQSTGCNWAGYAVADSNSSPDQVYYVDSIWYLQKAYIPTSGQSCTVIHPCEISQWDGLTDSGGAHIIQAVTKSYLIGSTNSYFVYLEVYPSGLNDECSNLPSSGDEMEGVVENQYYYDGTSGSNYYFNLWDWTANIDCTPVHGNPISVTSFTPKYAAFEAEREQAGTNVLAATTSMEFYNCQFATSLSSTGVWQDYNYGDGFGSSIYNNGYNETYPGTMYHNSGSYVGYFGINYLTSNGTP
jgi:hypothetical protein